MTNNNIPDVLPVRADRRTIDLILLVLFAALSLGLVPVLAAKHYDLWYRAGRTNDLSVLDWGGAPVYGIAFLFLGVALLTLVLITFVRLLVKWRRSSRRMRIERGVYLLAMVVMLVAAVSFVKPGVEPQGKGFQQWAQENADIEAIRVWAATLTDIENQKEIPDKAWPPAVAKLSPRMVDKEGEGTVRFIWGGGFIAPYGIVVGPESLVSPQTDRERRIRPLALGSYVYLDNG